MPLLDELIDEKHVSIENSDALSGIIRDSFDSLGRSAVFPDYFYLTELVNPAQSYWKRKLVDTLEIPIPLRRKFAIGNRIGRLVGIWLNSISGSINSEATLDGVYVGIEGIRGRIDFRLNDSIIEIKSKPVHVDNQEMIFSNFPQDLEQLIFYSVLSTQSSRNHFLIFVTDIPPYQPYVYRVTIKDMESARTLLIKRKNDYMRALETEDPSILFQCRYFPSCRVNELGQCTCTALPIETGDKLRDLVELERDTEFESKLIFARDNKYQRVQTSISPFSLLFPRKWYLKNIEGIEDRFIKSSQKEADESLLWKAIKMADALSPADTPDREWITEPFMLRVSNNFITYRESGCPDIVIPFISKVSNAYSFKYTQAPHEIHVGTLAIICAYYNIEKGVIFTLYPFSDMKLSAYVVDFSDIARCRDLISKQIEMIHESVTTQNPAILDPCLGFMKRDCDIECLCK